MRFAVYIIESVSSGQYYIGCTGDLQKRLEYHNAGKSRWTRGRGPWRLVYEERHSTRGEALRRERQIKRMKSREQVQRLVDLHRANREQSSSS